MRSEPCDFLKNLFNAFVPELCFPPRDTVQLHSSRVEQEHNKATKTTVMVPIATVGMKGLKTKFKYENNYNK